MNTNATTIQAEQLHLLMQAVDDSRKVNFGAAAALTWVAYDYCLTFEQEVRLIWPSRWSAAKILYLLIRYYTLFTLTMNLAVNTNSSIPLDFCKGWFWYIGYNGPLLSTALGEALLLLRVNALYGWNTKVILVTMFLWLVEIVTAIVIVAVQVSASTVLPRPPDFPIPGCVAMSPPGIRLSLVAWVVVLVVSCCFFLFTFWKFIGYLNQIYHDELSFKTVYQFQKLAPTIHLFVRDGAFYFLLAFVAQLLNLIFIVLLSDRPIQQMLTAWVMALYAILSTRVMHNLRGSGDKVVGMRSVEMNNLTTIAFDTSSPAGSRTLVGQDTSPRARTDSGSELSLHNTISVKH